jgi:hypothetical protein
MLIIPFLSTTIFLSQNIQKDKVEYKFTQKINERVYLKFRKIDKVDFVNLENKETKYKLYLDFDF